MVRARPAFAAADVLGENGSAGGQQKAAEQPTSLEAEKQTEHEEGSTNAAPSAEAEPPAEASEVPLVAEGEEGEVPKAASTTLQTLLASWGNIVGCLTLKKIGFSKIGPSFNLLMGVRDTPAVRFRGNFCRGVRLVFQAPTGHLYFKEGAPSTRSGMYSDISSPDDTSVGVLLKSLSTKRRAAGPPADAPGGLQADPGEAGGIDVREECTGSLQGV